MPAMRMDRLLMLRRPAQVAQRRPLRLRLLLRLQARGQPRCLRWLDTPLAQLVFWLVCLLCKRAGNMRGKNDTDMGTA